MTSGAVGLRGTIPNASGTPLGEVGGLAVFEGVLMRSRTGFSLALRRKDGSIHVRQVPFASLISQRLVGRIPIIRGAASLADMMVLGTRALRLSADEVAGREDVPDDRRFTLLLVASTAMLAALMVVVPNAAAQVLLSLITASRNEADMPVVFNLLAGLIRLLLLVGYVAMLSSSREIRRVFEYHGAEHKAVLALEKGRDVTVGLARLQSTIHPRCGTTFLAVVALLSIVLFSASDAWLASQISGFPDWPVMRRKLVSLALHMALLPVAVGIAFEVLKWCSRNWSSRLCRWALAPGLWLQHLTTRQPDDRQVEVAIVALFAALAIAPNQRYARDYIVRGLEDDESAPGYIKRSPARPAGESLREAH